MVQIHQTPFPSQRVGFWGRATTINDQCTVFLVWPSQWACTATSVLKQTLDLIGQCCCVGVDQRLKQWHVSFLRLASHMTELKLQSEWNAQIPFPGPRIASKFLFHHRGWGLGTRLLIFYLHIFRWTSHASHVTTLPCKFSATASTMSNLHRELQKLSCV